jgi:hypothetical protein
MSNQDDTTHEEKVIKLLREHEEKVIRLLSIITTVEFKIRPMPTGPSHGLSDADSIELMSCIQEILESVDFK